MSVRIHHSKDCGTWADWRGVDWTLSVFEETAILCVRVRAQETVQLQAEDDTCLNRWATIRPHYCCGPTVEEVRDAIAACRAALAEHETAEAAE